MTLFSNKFVHIFRITRGCWLARPGRKQATETKLGIYSTYSPQGSIHFLVGCSNFCKPLKNQNSESYPSNQVSAAAMTPASDEKWRSFDCFSVQGTGGNPTGPDLENRVGDQDIGSPGRPVFLGCKCPVSRGIVVQEQEPLGDLSAVFFLQNVLQLHQQRWVIRRVDSLALWKIILIPKNWGENFSSGFLHSELFGAGWVLMPPLHWLLLCLRVIVT